MKGITFWGIFAAVQLVGLLVAIPGGPHTGFGYWVVSGVLLFPGSALGPFLLDKLGIAFGRVDLPVAAVLVNAVCWYLAKLLIERVRRGK
jgi:hypothetical protein